MTLITSTRQILTKEDITYIHTHTLSHVQSSFTTIWTLAIIYAVCLLPPLHKAALRQLYHHTFHLLEALEWTADAFCRMKHACSIQMQLHTAFGTEHLLQVHAYTQFIRICRTLVNMCVCIHSHTSADACLCGCVWIYLLLCAYSECRCVWGGDIYMPESLAWL